MVTGEEPLANSVRPCSISGTAGKVRPEYRGGEGEGGLVRGTIVTSDKVTLLELHTLVHNKDSPFCYSVENATTLLRSYWGKTHYSCTFHT